MHVVSIASKNRTMITYVLIKKLSPTPLVVTLFLLVTRIMSNNDDEFSVK